jgi:sortase A
MKRPRDYIKVLYIVVLVAASLWHWGHAITILAKANLAKLLIHNAWEQTLTTTQEHKPWPWADTWPIAKIVFPELSNFYILHGSAGNSLAFGPGHVSATAQPGNAGTSVIAGHRDTHFSLLKNLQAGEQIRLQNKQGEWMIYEIDNIWIANSKTEPLTINNNQDRLLLITCYPFNAINPGGEQRFLVSAVLTE